MKYRYRVGPGLPSVGLAYDFAVLDTTKPDDSQAGFETVCECLTETQARKIANALNLADDVTIRYALVLKIGDDAFLASPRLYQTKDEVDFAPGSRIARLLIPAESPAPTPVLTSKWSVGDVIELKVGSGDDAVYRKITEARAGPAYSFRYCDADGGEYGPEYISENSNDTQLIFGWRKYSPPVGVVVP